MNLYVKMVQQVAKFSAIRMFPNITYTGPRIHLRQLREEDIPAIVVWTVDMDVMKHVAMRTFNLEEEKAWYQHVLHDDSEATFAICLNDDHRIIGSCGIMDQRNPNAVEIGILIGDKNEWGKGYAAEAIELLLQYTREHLVAKKAWLKVDSPHCRAIRAYEKAGFTVTKEQDNLDRIHGDGKETIMERDI